MALDIDRTVLHRFKAAEDLELHSSLIKSPSGSTFAELREFVPSLGKYGRGITFPDYALDQIWDGLEKVALNITRTDDSDG